MKTSSNQQGIVLVIALVMMAVMAVSSAVAIKTAMRQDMVGASLRAKSSALQAAEAALRYCESAVTAPHLTAAQAAIPISPPVATGVAPLWSQVATWTGPSAAVTVLPATFAFEGSGQNLNRPQCMIEEVSLKPASGWDPSSPAPRAYVITARGFSADYQERNNTPVNGAVMWLQSTVQVL